MLLVFLADAHARVLHIKVQKFVAGVAFAADAQLYAAAGRKFNRITQQVEQHLFEPQPVAPEFVRYVCLHLTVKGQAFLFQGKADGGMGEFQHFVKAVVGAVQLHFVCFNFGKVQNVVDDVQQTGGGSPDFLQIVALFWVGFGLQSQQGKADNAVHGRADFMAHVGEKFALGLRSQHGLFSLALIV